MELDEFCERFDREVSEDVTSKSVGGFIVEKLGLVPKPGESYIIDGLKFIIERVDKRRIFKVKYIHEVSKEEKK
jgi:putative hemolysin